MATKFQVPERRLHVVDFQVVEFRDMRDDDGTFTIIGHAAVFDRLSEDLGGFREKITRGAFGPMLDRQDDVRLLKNHDKNYVLARTKSGTLELSEDPRGLRVYAKVGDYTYARDVKLALERGDMDQMSFAFSEPVAREDWAYESDEEGNITNVIRTIEQFDRVFDVSVVTFPAYPQTEVSAKSLRTIGFDEPEGPDVSGCDGCEDPDCGFCRAAKVIENDSSLCEFDDLAVRAAASVRRARIASNRRIQDYKSTSL